MAHFCRIRPLSWNRRLYFAMVNVILDCLVLDDEIETTIDIEIRMPVCSMSIYSLPCRYAVGSEEQFDIFDGGANKFQFYTILHTSQMRASINN